MEGGDEYTIRVVVDAGRLELFGLTISAVTDAIRARNRDIPIGNFEVSGRAYDFRVGGKYETSAEITSTRIPLPNG